MPLTQGRVAIVDNDDLQRCLAWASPWHAFLIHRTWYAATSTTGGRRLYLHRFILNAASGQEVDHENGNGLDNRRDNLRLVTHQQNLANQKLSRANTSGYRGVSWYPRDKRWVAQSKTKGRHIHLGYFDDPVEAARARDAYMLATYGSYAALNFPPNEENA